MQILAPDILKLTKELSPGVCVVGLVFGLLLWLFGAYSHRFWLAMTMTLAAGVAGLHLGRDYAVQPLVAGMLLALAAGAMALALARITLFLAGGVVGLLIAQAAGSGWNELVCFLTGGLIGVVFYNLWIATLSSLVGTVLMTYSLVSLLDRLGRLDSVAWADPNRNGPLISWGMAAWALLGVLVQYLLERRRKRRAAKPEKKEEKKPKPEDAPPPPPPPPAPPPLPPPPPPPKPTWWEKFLGKKAD